jgi:hypothetical protein
MNKIVFYRNNDENFYLIDRNSKLNIVHNLKHVLYTPDYDGKLNATGVNTSFNDEYVLYNGHQNLNDFLSIIISHRLRGGDTENFFFNFETSTIYDIIVSKNKNRVAIVFDAFDYYSVKINYGENVRHEADGDRSVDNYYLHVYDFSEYDTRLIFQKVYNREIKVALSYIDTIAIASLEQQYQTSFEVYDLTTGNNLFLGNQVPILNTSSIACMDYLPFTPQLPNHLVIITRAYGSIHHLRVIDLRANTYIEIWNNIVHSNITCIDISRNGRIALGGDNGALVYHSFGSNSSTYFQGRRIQKLSLSRNAVNLGVTFNNYNPAEEHIIPLITPDTVAVVSLQQGVPGVEQIIFRYPDYPDEEYIVDLDDDDDDDDDDDSDDDVDDDDDDDDDDGGDGYHDEEGYDDGERELEIEDPQLDTVVPIQPTNQQKLLQHGNDNCFDFISGEENIGKYLSDDPDNLVIFYKKPSDAGFLATCCTFSRLKKYLKDPHHIFYTCIDGYEFRNYHRNPPEFLKIPTGNQTIFVSYPDMKTKYLQRQNMIFLEHSNKVEKTISYDASYFMYFVSRNHCQNGSVIDVYKIIF